MNRAIDLVTRHLESWNTRDNEVISKTIAFPFVQYDQDGSMIMYADRSELFDFSALNSFTTSLEDAEVVLSGPLVSVVKLGFRWEYPEQDFIGIGDAVWGLEDRNGDFYLRWRQFIGWRDDVKPK
ncbi:MAG: hypothetical protein PVF85_14255 [Anaerolineales bacterium]|jgi:hypothetical protein